MRILFVGNSITRGEVGESFVVPIQLDNPTWNIRNAGVDGDTLKDISNRLINIVSDDPHYDYVIIEAGHNDILLPQFNKKGILFRFALRHLQRAGRKPLAIADFSAEYLKMIKELRTRTGANTVLTTLSCINENLRSETNVLRREYNTAIKNIAKSTGCILADIAAQFDRILEKSNQTDYLLKYFLPSAYLDKMVCRQKRGAKRLSRKRNLRLTIDGIHLNKDGANLYKQTIEVIIRTGR